ncbi:MAG: site-2 protease family protein [Thaumarchaeota archaeon]|nr:site-2 protease family protein [Nitrososphaerota archaeon]
MQEDYKRVTFNYGIVMLRTRKGLALMDTLGKQRITGPLAWLMLYLLPISGGIALVLILEEFFVYLSPRGGAVASYVVQNISPTANLLLPGINPYVPVVYGLIALVTAVTIHEFSHGIVARSLGLRVKSVGVIFLLILPVGAFVEVDETELRETKARNSLRVLAAGSGINFIVGLVCLALLIFSVASMVPVTNGSAIVGVSQGTSTTSPSPAWAADIRPGDFIVAIDGVSNDNLATLNLQPFQVINITIWRDGQTRVLPNVKLGEIVYTNTQTHQNTTAPYLGVQYLGYQSLKGTVTSYVHQYSRFPVGLILYVIPPAFPGIAGSVPFSDQLKIFYTSPLGVATNAVQNLLFWLFFINFNLAIFNNLPIYPMDGGQALERFLVGVGRGKIGDALARRVTTGVTLLLVFVLVAVVAGPYLFAYLT